jgi:hypothetical protein
VQNALAKPENISVRPGETAAMRDGIFDYQDRGN